MQNFIVLGIVPGTNLQLTFSFWIAVAMCISGLLSVRKIISILAALIRVFQRLSFQKVTHYFDRFEFVTP